MKNCIKCNAPFEPKKKNQKYCSPKCSVNPQWGWQDRGSWSNYLKRKEK